MNNITKSALALGLISAVSLPALAAGTDGVADLVSTKILTQTVTVA